MDHLSGAATKLGSFLYPVAGSSRRQLIAALAWSGVLGIIMMIGLVVDHGLVGRIGALVVLGGLVAPLWVRGLPLLRASPRR